VNGFTLNTDVLQCIATKHQTSAQERMRHQALVSTNTKYLNTRNVYVCINKTHVTPLTPVISILILFSNCDSSVSSDGQSSQGIQGDELTKNYDKNFDVPSGGLSSQYSNF
jgi:hypothetical protein